MRLREKESKNEITLKVFSLSFVRSLMCQYEEREREREREILGKSGEFFLNNFI